MGCYFAAEIERAIGEVGEDRMHVWGLGSSGPVQGASPWLAGALLAEGSKGLGRDARRGVGRSYRDSMRRHHWNRTPRQGMDSPWDVSS